MRAAEELEYEPNHAASALRRGQTNLIGLVVGNIMEPFFAELIRVVSEEARSRGYALLVADNEYRTDIELEQLKVFTSQRVAGLILRSGFGPPNLAYLKRMQLRGTVIVEVDYTFDDSPFGHVLLANREAVFEGVAYLHDLGHERIAALASFDADVTPEERSHAFVDAMESFDLAIPREYTRVVSLLDSKAAYDFTMDLMRLPTPPTALFALNGNQAIGAFRALRDLGKKVPEDVSLLAFDDYAWTTVVDPPLDVFRQPVEEMGRTAMADVVEAIESKTVSGLPRRRFAGKLIKRGSCAAA